MNKPTSTVATETLSVVIEREIPYAAEKIWRALTQPHLIQEWLMKNDFMPTVDHRFQLRADWGTVECQVLVVEPQKTLTYTWAAMGLESIVTWTLSPAATSAGPGTLLRMEQSGFRPDQQQAYHGAKAGWPHFFAAMERVLAKEE
ncbi:SRPBCC domain-containing protein [Undibacterium sp.]|uniref:SRPBCC family protein n=1 Tax=Undibacterium sp. TaxID=1914977 RepID=UPI00374DD19A